MMSNDVMPICRGGRGSRSRGSACPEFFSLHLLVSDPPPFYEHAHFKHSGRGKREAHTINWSMVARKMAALVWNKLEVYSPCAGGLSAVNAIGTQLRDPINWGLTQWRKAV